MKRAAIFAALFVLAPAVMAQEVTITAKDGTLQLIGRVIGFDGQFLQLTSDYGPLTLTYANVVCAGDACPDPEDFVPVLRITGAQSMGQVLMPALVDAFARSQGYIALQEQVGDTFAISLTLEGQAAGQFIIRLTTTDEGFADLIAHETDMVMAVREVRADEVERGIEAGVGKLDDPAQSRIVGLDALVPIVSPQQNVNVISLQALARVFSDRVTNWADIGGAEQGITLHLGPAGSGQAQRFIEGVVQQAGYTLSETVTRHDTLQNLTDAVAADVAAIGVVPYGETGNAQALTLRDACGFVSVPLLSSLKTEDYPLTAPLFLYLPERRLPALAHDFLTWLRSPQAKLVVRRAGFVDQGAIPISLDAQGQRFANAILAAGPDMPLAELKRMVRVLTARTRQSTSFRFEVGSTRLDAQSRSNLFELGQAIRDGDYRNRDLLFVGFSDGRGAADANRDLSNARAEAVERALLAVLGGSLPADVTLETEAFGEALPMGCDDTEWGRQMNRRVELWVSD